MLVNGAKLKYKTSSEGTYTVIPGVKDWPKFAGQVNRVDNSSTDDTSKQYEIGQKDYGDLVFRIRLRHAGERAAYAAMRDLETAGTEVMFRAELGGEIAEFTGTVATGLFPGGGGPDSPVDWELTVGLGSDITVTEAT